ncbi:hypothetical protein [Wenxinia marina]|uniref:DedA family protein n=1 Tax=Wenxinia marina DSM 24838 TaxID=1123501 RepID=A0A0D0PEQ9_9RHOB|nr:hypothetical protein [Wenxinia marina]KIQ69886.1 hypothetical protein Wenmar_01456 [Wenxinia marina DSM 24838]
MSAATPLDVVAAALAALITPAGFVPALIFGALTAGALVTGL